MQAAFAAKAAPAGAARSVSETLDGAAAKLAFSGPLPAYPAS